MLSQTNRSIVCRLFEEGYNSGNMAAVDEVVSNHLICHPDIPGLPSGRVGISQMITTLRAGFPDLQVLVDDLVAMADIVMAREIFCGTHLGQFMDVPPTGLPIAWTRIAVYRLADGKIVERWSEADLFGMLRQLNAMNTSKQAHLSEMGSRHAIASGQ